MKYINNKLTIALLLVASLVGCNKFLDEPAPSDKVAATSVFSSPSGVRAYFNGLYRNLKERNGPDGGISTDEEGTISVLVTSEVKGIDVVNTEESGWYRSRYRHEEASRNKDSDVADFIWEFYYDLISQTNLLILGLNESSLSDTDKKAFIGEAKAIRAWCYFNLVREYAHNVPGNKAVPIYTEATNTNDLSGKARSTVQEVYALIVEDLVEAVENVPVDRLSKSSINRNVANGILARVYSTTGTWDQSAWSKAIIAAQEARVGYDLNASKYGDQFTNIDSDEWIWGADQTAEQHTDWGNLASWWDLDWSDGKDGYSNFTITHEFRNLFSNTDVRNLFSNHTARSYDDWQGNQMFGTTKFNLKGDFSEDFVLMRSSEMLLIEAEAEYENGSDANAAALLFELQSNRDVNETASGNTGQALLDEILIERRKELYCELGVSFQDPKRKRYDLVRGITHDPAYRFTIPVDDPRLILDIPISELETNKNINN